MASTSSSTVMASCDNACSYDVFLSFRGEDTRHSFTDHLYHNLIQAKICVFRDEEDIQKGEELKPEIEKAIKASRASIVVLSENYATSSWCLEELVLILEQKRMFGHLVLPVFYHVNPTDVRNHKGSFGIEKDRWKIALTEVANLSGFTLAGAETRTLKEIVDTIHNRLDKKVHPPPNTLGMDSHSMEDKSMEIYNSSHPHTLILKHVDYVYNCWGCDQEGYGLSYVCSEGCKFVLHKQCGKPQSLIEYPFSTKCILRFQDRGPRVDSRCDACGDKIKRYHYRCTCKCIFHISHLHPSCHAEEKTLIAEIGLTLHLEKEATSECLHCGSEDLRFGVPGWAYVSSCGSYCYHVSCVKRIIIKHLENGFFTGRSDPFLIFRQQFLKDKDRRMNQPFVSPRERTSIFFQEVVGDVIDLIDDFCLIDDS